MRHLWIMAVAAVGMAWLMFLLGLGCQTAPAQSGQASSGGQTSPRVEAGHAQDVSVTTTARSATDSRQQQETGSSRVDRVNGGGTANVTTSTFDLSPRQVRMVMAAGLALLGTGLGIAFMLLLVRVEGPRLQATVTIAALGSVLVAWGLAAWLAYSPSP